MCCVLKFCLLYFQVRYINDIKGVTSIYYKLSFSRDEVVDSKKIFKVTKVFNFCM